ncbi:MAG TPA: alpha/beta hydrolase [Dehalococcoidia bacterium]|nr:alpha/beta hydrolase [Dehalococcoidia bacterium]
MTRRPQPGFVDLRGTRLRYWDWPGTGRTVLMVHATGFLGRIWDPVVESLPRDYRVIAVDQRGHGDSDKPDIDYDWRYFVEDVTALTAALEIEGCVAVGHSGGGAAIACAEIERPGLFAGLVLIEPIAYPGPRRPVVPREGAPDLPSISRNRRLVWDSREEILESWRSRPPFDSWSPAALEAYVQHGFFERPDGKVELKCPGEYEARMFEQSFSLNTFERLPELSAPNLVIFGENTDTFPGPLRDTIAGRLRNSERHDISGAGHFVVMEKPEAVAAEIEGFIQNRLDG